jgi:EAL domain-containing protein (putative c-di-GMP-specific phosphodiesterase class I)
VCSFATAVGTGLSSLAYLGMRTVCEGVESAPQLAAVVRAGCH